MNDIIQEESLILPNTNFTLKVSKEKDFHIKDIKSTAMKKGH